MAEIKVYTVAVGNLPMPWHPRKLRKAGKQAVEFIKNLDGFVGFHPVPPRGTLCLFRTENQAKIAKNEMDLKGIQTGFNICECFVDEMYVPKETEQ